MKILKQERPKPKWVVAWGCDSNSIEHIGLPAKIGRLPRGVREELNRRLQQREPGAHLAKWLNGLPEAQSAPPGNPGCAKVTVGDLADWKKGGFRDWEARQERRRNIARHCLNWAKRPETQDKVFGRRQTWLEIHNEIGRILGQAPLAREDLPADEDWDAIPTPKQRIRAGYSMFGLTPEGNKLENSYDAMGYFGPPRAKSAAKKTINPQQT
jgi:hypothetical protein